MNREIKLLVTMEASGEEEYRVSSERLTACAIQAVRTALAAREADYQHALDQEVNLTLVSVEESGDDPLDGFEQFTITGDGWKMLVTHSTKTTRACLTLHAFAGKTGLSATPNIEIVHGCQILEEIVGSQYREGVDVKGAHYVAGIDLVIQGMISTINKG